MVKKFNSVKDLTGDKDDPQDVKQFRKAIKKAVSEPLAKEANEKHRLLEKLRRLRLVD